MSQGGKGEGVGDKMQHGTRTLESPRSSQVQTISASFDIFEPPHKYFSFVASDAWANMSFHDYKSKTGYLKSIDSSRHFEWDIWKSSANWKWMTFLVNQLWCLLSCHIAIPYIFVSFLKGKEQHYGLDPDQPVQSAQTNPGLHIPSQRDRGIK